MPAAKGKMRVPYPILPDPTAGIPTHIFKAIGGMAAVSLLVLCQLIAQTPTDPKKPAQAASPKQGDSESSQLPQLVILQPQGIPPNHWISFQLEGTQSNRLALNARVRATAGDLVQTGELVSGGSYISQHDLRIHFGLGARDHIDKAEINWPNGKVETLTNLSADHFYKVKEGQGVVGSQGPSVPTAKHE